MEELQGLFSGFSSENPEENIKQIRMLRNLIVENSKIAESQERLKSIQTKFLEDQFKSQMQNRNFFSGMPQTQIPVDSEQASYPVIDMTNA